MSREYQVSNCKQSLHHTNRGWSACASRSQNLLHPTRPETPCNPNIFVTAGYSTTTIHLLQILLKPLFYKLIQTSLITTIKHCLLMKLYKTISVSGKLTDNCICAVPEKIHTHPKEGHWEFLGGRWSYKSKF